tara:strand:- start:1153 stop:1593 length:441 start_codon:yes stop_codon:yes gene_type:complete
MLPESLQWAQENWPFSLALLVLVSSVYRNKNGREAVFGLVFFIALVWGAWRLISAYLLDGWGVSALNIWSLGEIVHGELPNVDLTILGWVMFVLALMLSMSDETPAPTKNANKQNTKKSEATTKKTQTEKALAADEKKVDNLFDDI